MSDMAGGVPPGRPRIRLRVSSGESASSRVDPSEPARRQRNRLPALRPLVRRALRLARHIEHLSADVTGAHASPPVPHLDKMIAGARAPKRLAATTRLARI